MSAETYQEGDRLLNRHLLHYEIEIVELEGEWAWVSQVVGEDPVLDAASRRLSIRDLDMHWRRLERMVQERLF